MNAETPHVDLCGSGTGSPLRYTTTGVPQIAATPKSAESGQTRPRRPPPRHAYARPMLTTGLMQCSITTSFNHFVGAEYKRFPVSSAERILWAQGQGQAAV